MTSNFKLHTVLEGELRLNDTKRSFSPFIRRWHVTHGGHVTAGIRPHMLKMFEEVVELCLASGIDLEELAEIANRECQKAVQRRKYKISDYTEQVEELGDVRVCLDLIESMLEVDINKIMLQTAEKLDKRAWQADHNGVLRRPR